MIGGQLAGHSTGQDCGNEAETQAFKDGIGEGLHSVLDFIPALEHGGVHVQDQRRPLCGRDCKAHRRRLHGFPDRGIRMGGRGPIAPTGDCPGDQVVFEGHLGIDAATAHMTVVASSGHCNTLRAGFLDDRFGGLCGDQIACSAVSVEYRVHGCFLDEADLGAGIDLPGLEFFYIASKLAGAVADHTPKVDSNQAIGNVLGIGTREVESAEDV